MLTAKSQFFARNLLKEGTHAQDRVKTCFCRAPQNLQKFAPKSLSFVSLTVLMSQIRTRSTKTHAKERQDNAKTGEMAEINQDKVLTTSQDQDGDESHFEDLLQKIRSIVKDEISEQVNELRKHITSQMDDLRDDFNRKIADIEESVQFAHSSVAELRTDMS